MSGIAELKELKRLNYSLNEVGPLVAEQISKMLLWPVPYNLEELTLNKVKTTNFAME